MLFTRALSVFKGNERRARIRRITHANHQSIQTRKTIYNLPPANSVGSLIRHASARLGGLARQMNTTDVRRAPSL